MSTSEGNFAVMRVFKSTPNISAMEGSPGKENADHSHNCSSFVVECVVCDPCTLEYSLWQYVKYEDY